MSLTVPIAEWLERNAGKRGVAGTIPCGGIYCKTLIIRVTLFSRGHHPGLSQKTSFSRFAISSSINLTLGEDFILASLCFRELTRK